MMLKYHNYSNPDEPMEIVINGERMNFSDELCKRFIDKMRSTYFALFDIISITDMDTRKVQIMKNKIKATTVEAWSLLMYEFNKDKDISVLTDSLKRGGMVYVSMNKFASFAFSNSERKEYFINESLKYCTSNLYSIIEYLTI